MPYDFLESEISTKLINPYSLKNFTAPSSNLSQSFIANFTIFAKSDPPFLIEKVRTPSSKESPQVQHNSIIFFDLESPFLAKAKSVLNTIIAIRRANRNIIGTM